MTKLPTSLSMRPHYRPESGACWGEPQEIPAGTPYSVLSDAPGGMKLIQAEYQGQSWYTWTQEV